MSHNPLTLITIGFLAPSSDQGGGVNIPVTALSVAASNTSLLAKTTDRQLSVGIQDRTLVSAIDNSKRLLIKVDNGTS